MKIGKGHEQAFYGKEMTKKCIYEDIISLIILKINIIWDNISHPLDKQKQTTLSAKEDVKQEEDSYTNNGRINRKGIHFGNTWWN